MRKEIPEGALKYTCRRYNLGIDTGEGEEILDPEIKIPEESDFYEPEPLDQVVDANKKWYKFLPKQGDVDKILAQINHKILRHKIATNIERSQGGIPYQPTFQRCIFTLVAE